MKKIFYTFSILTISLVLSSCHGKLSNYDVDYPEKFDISKEYNIVFWAKNDSRNDQLDVYKNAISSFETFYPNIHVELKNYTDYNLIYNDVIINIPTKTTPNVCIAYPDHVATYMEGSNVVANLDQLIANESYGLGGKDVKFSSTKKEEIYPKFFDEGLINNKHTVLPFVRSSEALYLNKEYVERLGFTIPDIPTWDWVWQVCEKAIEEKAQDQVLYPLIYKSTDNMFITMKKQQGKAFTENGEVKFLNDDTKNMLVDLYNKANDGLFSTFKLVSYPANFLNKWQAVMAVDSTAGSTWMGYNASTHDAGSAAEGEPFETVVRPIPQYDINNPKMISQGPSICVFGKDNPDEVVASWLFAQFLLTNDVQIGYAKTEGYIPVTTKATNSNEYKSYLANPNENKVKLAASKLVVDNINNTFITEVYNGSTYARSASSYLIEAVAVKNSDYKTFDKMDELFQKAIRFNNLDTSSFSYSAIILLSALFGVIILLFLLTFVRRKK